MKKVFAHLITLALFLSVLTPAVHAELLLSELCDPREDYLTDRFIEIFNSGSGTRSCCRSRLLRALFCTRLTFIASSLLVEDFAFSTHPSWVLGVATLISSLAFV